MSNYIEHPGIVQSVKNNVAAVKIIQNSACSACHARSACMASDQAEKIIDVPYSGITLNTGERVIITGVNAIGRRAVIFAFLLPFAVLFAVLLIIYAITGNDLMAGLSALASLLPYYLILYIFRNRMKKQLTFSLRKE